MFATHEDVFYMVQYILAEFISSQYTEFRSVCPLSRFHLTLDACHGGYRCDIAASVINTCLTEGFGGASSYGATARQLYIVWYRISATKMRFCHTCTATVPVFPVVSIYCLVDNMDTYVHKRELTMPDRGQHAVYSTLCIMTQK